MLYIHYYAHRAESDAALGADAKTYETIQMQGLREAKQKILMRTGEVGAIGANLNDPDINAMKELVEEVVINNSQFDSNLQHALDTLGNSQNNKSVTSGSKVSGDFSYQSIGNISKQISDISNLAELKQSALSAAKELCDKQANIISTIETDLADAFALMPDVVKAAQSKEMLDLIRNPSVNGASLGFSDLLKSINDGAYNVSRLSDEVKKGVARYLSIQAKIDRLKSLNGNENISLDNFSGLSEGARLIGQIGGIFNNTGGGIEEIANTSALAEAGNQIAKTLGLLDENIRVMAARVGATCYDDPDLQDFLNQAKAMGSVDGGFFKGDTVLVIKHGSTYFSYVALVKTENAKWRDSKKLIGNRVSTLKMHTTTLAKVIDNAASSMVPGFHDTMKYNLPAVHTFRGISPSENELQSRWTAMLNAALALNFADFLVGAGQNVLDSANIIVHNRKIYSPNIIAAKVLEHPNLISMAFTDTGVLKNRARIAEENNIYRGTYHSKALADERSDAAYQNLTNNLYSRLIHAKLDLMQSALLI